MARRDRVGRGLLGCRLERAGGAGGGLLWRDDGDPHPVSAAPLRAVLGIDRGDPRRRSGNGPSARQTPHPRAASAGDLGRRDDGRAPPAWLLPLMALWANLHSSFTFGLALGLFLGGEAVVRRGTRLQEAA